MSYEPVKIAFIGLSGINGWHYLPGMEATSRAVLVGGVDPSDQARQKFGQRASAPLYATFADLIAHEDVEAVFIGTPNPVHPENVNEAAAAGLHMSVTKPLCNTVRESAQVVELCRREKLILQVSHEYRFRPTTRQAIAIARSGDLGEVTMVTAHMGHRGGFSNLTAQGTWRSDPANVPGGCLNLLGVHMFDIANAILGRPLVVSAQLNALRAQGGMEDTVAVTVEYESGKLGVITSSYITDASDLIHVLGATESLLVLDAELQRKKNRDITAVQPLPPEGSAQVVIEQFCDAVRGVGSLDTPGEVGLLAVAMNEAAVRSTREESRRVKLEEILP